MVEDQQGKPLCVLRGGFLLPDLLLPYLPHSTHFMASGSIKLLNQHQFDKYAAAWSRYVSHHHDLTAIFQQPDGSPLQALSFSFDALQYLLSTVGARRIKAQFLLKEDEVSAENLFTLALYATDALDGRISAYYLAQYLPAPAKDADAASKTDLADTDSLGGQIPNELVHTWLNNWKEAPLATAAMFGSTYGPLTGYSFAIDDFLDSFFYANKFKEKELVVLFGLHQHFPAFPDCYTMKQTFGLVLRIHQLNAGMPTSGTDFDAEKETISQAIEKATTHAELVQVIQQWEATYGEIDGQPFYDFSSPSPPY
jgi:hypothetical protein